MTSFAHIDAGVVVELFTPPPGVPITECFAPGMIWVAVAGSGAVPGWSYDGSTFSAPVTPTVPLSEQAAAQLATRIAAGIAIACTGNSALDATYALDDATMGQIGAVARDDAAGLGLPGGDPTFTYPDASGVPRIFTGARLQALYRAQRDLLFHLQTQAAAMAAGGTPVWPVQTATIA
jgi:hypothetical protein